MSGRTSPPSIQDVLARADELRKLTITGPQVLPDGSRVAYTVKTDTDSPHEIAAAKSAAIELQRLHEALNHQKNLPTPEEQAAFEKERQALHDIVFASVKSEAEAALAERADSRTANANRFNQATAGSSDEPTYNQPDHYISVLWPQFAKQQQGADWRAPRTFKANERMFNTFLAWAEDRDVRTINKVLISKFKDHLRNRVKVQAGIFDSFRTAINGLTIRETGTSRIEGTIKLRDTRPFRTQPRGFLQAKKSVFNRIVGEGSADGLELAFAAFLDGADDVQAFGKNYMAVGFKIDYVKANGELSTYTPDFIVRTKDGAVWIVETKGREELDLPQKMRRLNQWCQDATEASKDEGGTKYGFVYVDQESFEQHKPTTFAGLVPATQRDHQGSRRHGHRWRGEPGRLRATAGRVEAARVRGAVDGWLHLRERVAELPHPPEPRLGTDDRFAHLRPPGPLHGGREGDRHLRQRHHDLGACERRLTKTLRGNLDGTLADSSRQVRRA